MVEECPSCERKQDRERIRDRVVDLLKNKGFEDTQIKRDIRIVVPAGDEALEVRIEAMVYVRGRPAMMVKCVLGSLATRERASISIARLFPGGTIPVAIVANDRDAVVLDTMTGRVFGRGYGSFPSADVVEKRVRDFPDLAIPAEKLERERRILLAYYHLRCAENREPF